MIQRQEEERIKGWLAGLPPHATAGEIIESAQSRDLLPYQLSSDLTSYPASPPGAASKLIVDSKHEVSYGIFGTRRLRAYFWFDRSHRLIRAKLGDTGSAL